MTRKRKTTPPDVESESALGEEDPGAALEEMSMSDAAEANPAPQGRPTQDAPLESPLPRSPTLEREEPKPPASEADIAPEDDAPSGDAGATPQRRGKVKRPGAPGSGGGQKRA